MLMNTKNYESKLATFIYILRNGASGFAFIWLVLNIPSFICLALDVNANTLKILFVTFTVISFVLYVLFLVFVKPDKINEKYLQKQKLKADKHSSDNNAQ